MKNTIMQRNTVTENNINLLINELKDMIDKQKKRRRKKRINGIVRKKSIKLLSFHRTNF